jgi:hypothetical protein
MMHLQYFLDVVNDPAVTSQYASWIGYQARSIINNAQQSNGDVGNIWSTDTNQIFGGEVIGMAVSAGNIAVKVCEISNIERVIILLNQVQVRRLQ